MKRNLDVIRFYLWGALSHVGIVLSLMFFVFLVVDRYNRAMAFINNDITKSLLLVAAILAIALCRMVIPAVSAYSKKTKALLQDLLIFTAMLSMTLIFVFFLDLEIMIINTTLVKLLITVFSSLLLLVSLASAIVHRKTNF